MHKRSAELVSLLLGLLVTTSPLVAYAQAATDVPSLFNFFLNILNNYVVPTIFAVAFAVFVLGVYRYFIYRGGDAERVAEGRRFVMWSMIGFVIMFSLWGLINLFTNTLGFSSSTRPNLPTFGGVTNTTGTINSSNGIFPTAGSGSTGSSGSTNSGGIFGNLFGNGSTGSSGATGSYGTTGSTGATGSNGTSGSTGSTGAGGSSASGGGSGAACINNTQCTGSNTVCNTATGTCTVDGPNVYSCSDDSTPTNGVCANGQVPTNQSGTPAPAGSNGSACSSNTQCSGNNVCNTVTGTCMADSANAYSCQDDSTPTNGVCANGQAPTNAGGTAAVPDGSVQIGGSCASNPNACAGSNTTCNDSGICASASSASAPADGSVGQGGSCAGNENACASGTCDADGICADDSSGNSTSGGVTQCDYGTVSGGLNCILCSDGSTTADSAADCPSGSGYTGSSEDTGNGASSGGSVPSNGNTGS